MCSVINDGYSVRPLIITWFTEPHRCLFTNLKTIELMFNEGHLTESLYYAWMECNSLNYICSSDNNSLFNLWHTRLPLIINVDPNTDFGAIDSAVSKYNGDHQVSLPTMPNLKISSNSRRYINECCFVYSCERHQLPHAQITKHPLCKKRRYVAILDALFPFSCHADQTKTNLYLSSLISRAAAEDEHTAINRALALVPIGTPNVTATSMVIHALGNPAFNKIEQMVVNDKACCMSRSSYHKYFKCVGDCVRRINRWPNGVSATLIEICGTVNLEMATGRGMNVADWVQEKINRTTNVMHLRLPFDMRPLSQETSNDFLIELKNELHLIMAQLIPSRRRFPTWKEFVDRRNGWTATGSTGGVHMKFDGERVNLNKRTAFEMIKTSEVMKWIHSEPKVVARGSDKFEPGKARSLYGTGMIDYTIFSHAINDIEKSLYNIDGVESGLSGAAEVAGIIRRLARLREQYNESTMIDYADFNLQHLLEAQSAVFDALANRYQLLGCEPEIVRSSRWCSDALLNQWCYFPQDEDCTRIVQGMFSGIRATSFLNTILNVCYTNVVMKQLVIHMNLQAKSLYRLHQGDDVWITNHSRLWAQLYYNAMLHCGFAFQGHKQLLDRYFAEYLRVLYGVNGTHGFLPRCVATYIIRPIQATDVTTPIEMVTALNSSIMTMCRRGLSLSACKIIWDATIPHFLRCQVNYKPFTIPKAVIAIPVAQGGLGLNPPGLLAKASHNIPSPPVVKIDASRFARALPSHMSQDWMRYVSSRVKEQMNAAALTEALHAMNVTDSMPLSYKMANLSESMTALRKWKSQLHLPTVTISSKLLYEELASGNINKTVQNQIDIVTDPNSHKDLRSYTHGIDSIFITIRTSAFQSIQTARLCMSEGVIGAFFACAASSHALTHAPVAIELVMNMLNTVGYDVTAAIISEDHKMPPHYASILHPIILSWAHALALTIAYEAFIVTHSRSLNLWNAMFDDIFHDVVKTILHDERLVEISNY